MTRYIYQLPDWPNFHWNYAAIVGKLSEVRHRQGRLIGQMEAAGFSLRDEAVLQTLTLDVLKSSEIEGERLDEQEVRSSIARRLGMDIAGLVPADRNVEGIVEMMLDATQNYNEPLTKESLLYWHTSLFPSAHSDLTAIRVGAWRDDAKGPMQVVSGPIGREKIHYEAPAAERLESEMAQFLTWFNTEDGADFVIKAWVAHLWFVTLHPFDDGNGRIARALADRMLARSEASPRRFYSVSAQIRLERNTYYDLLEDAQKGTLDITESLSWFLDCLTRAFDGVETLLSGILRKANFWRTHAGTSLNERQKLVLNRLFDGFEGNLTSTKWAKLAKCSQDTAARDIQDLVTRGILAKNAAGGRSTSYSIVHA